MGNLSGFDKVIYELRRGLESRLSWLNSAYGRADVLVRKSQSSREVKYPAIYRENENYLELLPNDELGNFSFVLLHDPKIYNKQSSSMSCYCSIVFWYNFNTVLPEGRDTERVIMEIVNALNSITYSCGSLIIETIQEEGRSIYKEFDYKEVHTQYRMQPYAGARINGVITYINM